MSKIVQIVTAERGWHVDVPDPEDETNLFPRSTTAEVVCWGLREDGVVVPFVRHPYFDYPTVEPIDDHRAALYSPAASFEYSVFHDDNIPDDDREFVSSLGKGSTLWRAKHRTEKPR